MLSGTNRRFTMTELQILGLADWLELHDYQASSGVPAFPTPQVCPLQDLYFEWRLSQGRPIALGVHSRPSRYSKRLPNPLGEIYRCFYLHHGWSPSPAALADWLDAEGRARWQVTALRIPSGARTFLSSIQQRSAGEFTYLGDDSGLLIEASWNWLRGRGHGRALDLCCGCGCVGQSLPPGFTEVTGLDANATALDLARANRVLNRLPDHYRYFLGDMWQEAEGSYDFVVGNPPALPIAGLLYASGGSDPSDLTIRAVQGLQQHLSMGGRCLLLSFSVQDRLWRRLEQVLSPEFSLEYRPRRHIKLSDASLGWMEHVWIFIQRDSRGLRWRRPMSGWDQLMSWALPGSRGEAPAQAHYAGAR